MRKILSDIQYKKRPLSMAHMGGIVHGPENSRQAILESLQYRPDIIEIDLRKSKDGIVFCRHGKMPFGLLYIQFSYFFPYKFSRKFFRSISTPIELLEVIPENIIVYLDIKDKHINTNDILEIKNRFDKHNIWLAAYSLKQLKELRVGLGEEHVYVFNRPVFFFDRFIDKAKGVVDIIQLFIWQWNDKSVKKAQSNGLSVHLARWFIRSSKKFKLGDNYDNPWLTYDDLRNIIP